MLIRLEVYMNTILWPVILADLRAGTVMCLKMAYTESIFTN